MKCPKCGSELDTGFNCPNCGYKRYEVAGSRRYVMKELSKERFCRFFAKLQAEAKCPADLIVFKGKEDDSEEWVFGYLTKERDTRGETPHVLKLAICWEEDGLMMRSFVRPETVCQWSGTLDRLGAPIFDRDVVRHFWNDGCCNDRDTACEVCTDNDYQGFYQPLGFMLRGSLIPLSRPVEKDMEVVGSIHDLPPDFIAEHNKKDVGQGNY